MRIILRKASAPMVTALAIGSGNNDIANDYFVINNVVFSKIVFPIKAI
jgi:hypothetical protein